LKDGDGADRHADERPDYRPSIFQSWLESIRKILGLPKVPAGLTMLAIYVRISVDPYVDAMPMPLRLVFPSGEEKRANEINAELLASAQADAPKDRSSTRHRDLPHRHAGIPCNQLWADEKQSLDQTRES
jgi:hypothetical protein